jgi:large subunit ribosomal protein L10
VTGHTEKAEKVAALHARFSEANNVILSDYRGLNVQQLSELRNRLRDAEVELQVVKNTLARRAVQETPLAELGNQFVGPTSVALARGDVVSMAKVLTEYAKQQPALEIRSGLIEGKLVSPQDIVALADLPPREVLLARLVGGIQAPLAGLVGVLQGVVRQLVYVLAAIKEAKESE